MLETWNKIVFSSIRNRLLAAAMMMVEKERNGEFVDPQIIIGIRESFGGCTFISDRFGNYDQF
jgi:hypothetical protein